MGSGKWYGYQIEECRYTQGSLDVCHTEGHAHRAPTGGRDTLAQFLAKHAEIQEACTNICADALNFESMFQLPYLG